MDLCEQIKITSTCKNNVNFRINGPFSALTCYLTEFHGAKYRSRIQIGRGMIISAANIVLPLLAWAILPKTMHFTLFNQFGKCIFFDSIISLQCYIFRHQFMEYFFTHMLITSFNKWINLRIHAWKSKILNGHG